MPLQLIRNDITKVPADAIVNAANSSLAAGGGVCGAIFDAAGYDLLERACEAIGHCPVGGAAVTPAFRLNAKCIIHAVGPIWRGGDHGERELLTSAYESSLRLAEENGCESIAFPLISAGIYGYPQEEAMEVAVKTIRGYLERSDSDLQVYLVLFGRGAVSAGGRYTARLESFIDDHYVSVAKERRGYDVSNMHQLEEQVSFEMSCGSFAEEKPKRKLPGLRRRKKEKELPPPDEAPQADEIVWGADICAAPQVVPFPQQKPRTLDEVLKRKRETFSEMLLRLIDEKGFTDVQVYKRANIDRKLFSKIRKPDYVPKKSTVLALAISLRLNEDEAVDFLKCAGYAFSDSSKADLIVRFFIQEGQYDIDTINATLFDYDEKLLGSLAG